MITIRVEVLDVKPVPFGQLADREKSNYSKVTSGKPSQPEKKTANQSSKWNKKIRKED